MELFWRPLSVVRVSFVFMGAPGMGALLCRRSAVCVCSWPVWRRQSSGCSRACRLRVFFYVAGSKSGVNSKGSSRGSCHKFVCGCITRPAQYDHTSHLLRSHSTTPTPLLYSPMLVQPPTLLPAGAPLLPRLRRQPGLRPPPCLLLP